MIDSIRKVLLPFALGLAPFAVAVAEDETRVSSSAKVEPSPASKSVVAGYPLSHEAIRTGWQPERIGGGPLVGGT